MPIYVYLCKKCNKEFEFTQKITEESLNNAYHTIKGKEPEVCNGETIRLIQPVNFSIHGVSVTPKFFKRKK